MNLRNNEDILCNCNHVSESEIKKLVAQGYGITQIIETTAAATGCGTCEPDIEDLINNYR